VRLLWRIGIFVVAVGFLVGFILRRTWGSERLPELLLLSFLPWLVHLIYALSYAASSLGALTLGTVLVGLVSVGIAVVLLRVGPRFYRRDARVAAALPLALALLHGILLGFWVALELQAQGVRFNTIPNLYFASGTLFVSAGLLGYAVAPFGDQRSLSKRRR